MPVTFDGTALTITLAAGVDGLQTIDAQVDLYTEWKDWLLSDSANRGFPFAFRTIGGDDLTPGVTAGAYFFIQNDKGWRIKFPESDEEVTLVGNLAPEDSSLPVVTPADGAFKSVLFGLQPITQNVDALLLGQQDAEYDGKVFLDIINGSPGVDHPVGTVSSPCNTMANVLTIAARLGIKHLVLIGNTTMISPMPFWFVEGRGADSDIDIGGQDISGTEFRNIGILGNCAAMTEYASLVGGHVSGAGVTNWFGVMRSSFIRGNISLQDGLSSFHNCSSDIVGATSPTLDCQDNSVDLSLRGWNGGLILANFSNAARSASFDFVSGAFTLNATVSDGALVIRGVCVLDDQTTNGATVDKDGLIDPHFLRIAQQMMAGRAVVSGDDLTVTIYETDDVTVLETFAISADGRIRTVT